MIRAPDLAQSTRVDDHMDASTMKLTKAPKHDYVKERGLFYDRPGKVRKGRKHVVHHSGPSPPRQGKRGASKPSSQSLDDPGDAVHVADVNHTTDSTDRSLEGIVAQLMERLDERDAAIERLETQLARQNVAEESETGTPEERVVGQAADNAGDKRIECKGEKMTSVGTQTKHSGEINDSVQRRRIRSLKRELRKERQSKELLSLISISSSQRPQRGALGFGALPWAQGDRTDSSLQIEHRVERMYYQRVRLLLDSHTADLAKVKSESERKIASLRNTISKTDMKMSRLKKRCRGMAFTIQTSRRAVEESQAKAVAVCKEALRELELERKESEMQAALAMQAQAENTRLAQQLKLVTHSLSELEKEKEQSRMNYERVLSVLNASAQNAASRSIFDASTADRSLCPMDFEVGVGHHNFSAFRQRPAGID
eukprot:g4968.t1